MGDLVKDKAPCKDVAEGTHGVVFLSRCSNSFHDTIPCVRVCSFTVNGSVHIYTRVYAYRLPSTLPSAFPLKSLLPFDRKIGWTFLSPTFQAARPFRPLILNFTNESSSQLKNLLNFSIHSLNRDIIEVISRIFNDYLYIQIFFRQRYNLIFHFTRKQNISLPRPS